MNEYIHFQTPAPVQESYAILECNGRRYKFSYWTFGIGVFEKRIEIRFTSHKVPPYRTLYTIYLNLWSPAVWVNETMLSVTMRVGCASETITLVPENFNTLVTLLYGYQQQGYIVPLVGRSSLVRGL